MQALVNPGFGQGPAIVTRNYRQLGIKLPLYQSHGVASKSFIELAGAAAEGVRLPAAALLVADKLPESRSAKTGGGRLQATYETATKQASVDLRRSRLRLRCSSWSARWNAQSRRPSQSPRRDREDQGLHRNCRHLQHVADDHMGLDLNAFKMLEDQARRLDAGPRHLR